VVRQKEQKGKDDIIPKHYRHDKYKPQMGFSKSTNIILGQLAFENNTNKDHPRASLADAPPKTSNKKRPKLV
jgi:hypothetical protein